MVKHEKKAFIIHLITFRSDAYSPAPNQKKQQLTNQQTLSQLDCTSEAQFLILYFSSSTEILCFGTLT